MFEIIIRTKQVQAVMKSGDWSVIDKVPWTDEELDKATRCYGDKESFLRNNPLHEINGRTPSYEVSEVKEADIFRQTVETLDLAAVIKAINGL